MAGAINTDRKSAMDIDFAYGSRRMGGLGMGIDYCVPTVTVVISRMGGQ